MDKDEFLHLENLMWKKWSTYTACASAHSLCNIEQYNKASTEYYSAARLYQLARKEMGLEWIISETNIKRDMDFHWIRRMGIMKKQVILTAKGLPYQAKNIKTGEYKTNIENVIISQDGYQIAMIHIDLFYPSESWNNLNAGEEIEFTMEFN